MSGHVHVGHVAGERFAVTVRGHTFEVDQPREEGGTDVGPTPVELFAASLASCIATLARSYCERHDVDAAGLEVTCDWTVADRPRRVDTMTVAITPPTGLPDERRAGFLAVASHCTVHNSLDVPPAVTVSLS
ncbi:MAG: OsmC family protein [Jatrophihabitans sp.]|uniref:OsmC family protein n=1 Tax=Jatrophihabitans sp. TaxID=1932789 RepID=UPI003F81425C